jgi:hypothetical protein
MPKTKGGLAEDQAIEEIANGIAALSRNLVGI